MNQERFNKIVGDLVETFHTQDPLVKNEFVTCGKSDLFLYHHSLGRHIRNEYNLWDLTWTPDMIDGCDHSPDHPDAVSMQIITEVWERLQ